MQKRNQEGATTRRRFLKVGAASVAGAADRRALYPQRRSCRNHDVEGADVMAGRCGACHVQAVVRHHQGQDRRRAGVQTVRRQGGGRRFRADRRRQERRAGGDEFVHRLLVGKNARGGISVVLSHGPALSARMGHLLLQQGRPGSGTRAVTPSRAFNMSGASITARTSSIRRNRSAPSRISRT